MNLVVDMASVPEKHRLYEVLKKLKPVRYIFDIKQYRLKRSINQNNYYWGVVLKMLSQETGFYDDEMHEHMKRKFNPVVKVIRQTGEEIVVGGSTSELKTDEFEAYLEKIRIWALADLDILIPKPNEK